MRKKSSRRTDIVIIVALLAAVVLAVLPALNRGREADGNGGGAARVSVESYNGKTMGTISGSAAEAVTVARFPDSPIVYYTGIPELFTAMLAGKIEGFVLSEITLTQMKRQNANLAWFPEALTTRSRYLGFQKTPDGEKLCAQLDEMLREFKADGTMAKLEDIWYGEDEALKTVDASGITGENGTLNVGVYSMDEPYSYIRDNELTGLNIDLVTRFAKRYGYDIQFTDTELTSLLMGLTTGKFDMLATAINYSEERAQQILFSEPVQEFNMMLAVLRTDLGDIAEEQPGFAQRVAESFEKTFVREQRWKLVLQGVGTTCLITLLSTLLGTALAFGVCLFRRTGSILANAISDIYVKLLQGTPIVVLLLILYYVVFGQSGLAAAWVAVVGFALHFGAYCSEILRSGVDSVDSGQTEAALALGYTERQAFYGFVLPQAVKRILPVYRGEIITLLKGTSVAGYISVQELTKMSDIIRSRTYETFFPLITTALIYFLLSWIIGRLLDRGMGRILARKGGERK